MSWGGKTWRLGMGTSPLSPVYGSSIPLSTRTEDVWIERCPLCKKALDANHTPIYPDAETMWLAKCYANALLAVWTILNDSEYKLPSMACAAKAIYGAGTSDERAVYYLAGPTASHDYHSFLSLPVGKPVVAAQDLDPLITSLSLAPRPTAINANDIVVFCDSLFVDPGIHGPGVQALAASLFSSQSSQFWDPVSGHMAGMRTHALRYTNPYGPHMDADKGFALLDCTEQRVLLCHRWVESSPAILGLPPGAELELKQMTVALADYDASQPKDLGVWWGFWDRGAGFPMHPCNTCRVVLPVLLCPQRDPIALPRPSEVIAVRKVR